MSAEITVCERVWLDDEAFELTCSRPEGFQFLAGQYVTLEYQGISREYTIVSPPDASELRFLIKRQHEGAFSSRLASVDRGCVLTMERLKGYLSFRPSKRSVVFVATGVGIAPFVSMAASGVRGFTLIHGVRKASGLFYRQEMMAAADRYQACISGGEQVGNLPGFYQGYVTDYVKATLPRGMYEFYLCGSRAMIHDMTHLLDEQYPDTVIYSEAYS